MSHGQAWPCTSQGHSALREAGVNRTLGYSLRRLPGVSCLAGKGLCDQKVEGKQLWESQALDELRKQGDLLSPHLQRARWEQQVEKSRTPRKKGF